MVIKFVYSDPIDKDRMIKKVFSKDFYLETYDEGSFKEKKLAYKVKGACAAKLTPFIAVYKDEELIKAFYSETGEDVIESLDKWLSK